jgi:uncharacterized cupin superfamily protein
VEVFNLFRAELDEGNDRDGFRNRDTPLGPRLGASLLGGSLYELAAGQRSWPYHFHHANEEWLLVVGGAPTLREPGGERVLAAGDVVAFPRGPEGAHQLRNDAEEPARFLMLSTLVGPEVVEYPDSGKVGVRAEGVRYLVARQPELEYWEGEA